MIRDIKAYIRCFNKPKFVRQIEDVEESTLTATGMSKNLAYIFICGPMNKEGGIATIVSEASNYLGEKKIGCAVLTFGDTAIRKLHKNTLGLNIEAKPFLDTCKTVARIFNGKSKLLIVGFDPKTAAYAILIGTYLKLFRVARSIKQLVYIVHPREFFPDFENRRTHAINRHFAQFIGPETFIYMNEATQRSHEAFLGWKNASGAILPIPLTTRFPRWKPSPAPKTPLRICSVGRIVKFKAYNFCAPEIAKKLAERGLEVTWDIFGYGEDVNGLRNILSQQTIPRVKLRGELPIENFDKVVSEYDVFVGMGLSALHAAQLGLPTILSIDSAGNECYGWLTDAPFGLVGEQTSCLPRYEIEEVLLRYAAMSADERIDISKRQIEYVGNYSIVKFIEGLNLVSPSGDRPLVTLPQLASLAFLFINSKSVRRLSRSIRTSR